MIIFRKISVINILLQMINSRGVIDCEKKDVVE